MNHRPRLSVALCTSLALVWSLSLQPAGAAPGEPDGTDAGVSGTSVLTTAVQPDGKILIGGDFTRVQGVSRPYLARLLADGTLDASFQPRPNAAVYSVSVQPDGKILVAGDFVTLQPDLSEPAISRRRIARLLPDGSVDAGFDPQANGPVYAVLAQPDGRIVLGGAFESLRPNGAPVATTRHYIARLEPDGSLDGGFNPNPLHIVLCLALEPGGGILLGGHFPALQPAGAPVMTSRHSIARLEPDGSLDADFDPKVTGWVGSMVVQPDGKIVIGGGFNSVQPNGAPSATMRRGLARLHGDGSLDEGFDPQANGNVYGLALQADGKILAGGNFTTLQPNGAPSATSRSCVARLLPDGSLDAGFDPRAGDWVYSVAIQGDGKILIGGLFSTLQPNGAPVATAWHRFARLENDPAPQMLEIPDGSTVGWRRGGAAGELGRVTFDLSTDGGASWSPLGEGSRVGTTADWERTGLSLPATGLLRARGLGLGGIYSGSQSLIEQTAAFNLIVDPVIQPLIRKGDAVPGAGVHPLIPAGAVFTTLYPPATNGSGQVAYRAKWKAGRASGYGIFLDSSAVVVTGEAAPDSGGATFKSLGDPQLSDGGRVAFLAITSAGTKGLFTDLGGSLRRAVAQGETLAAPAGARVKSVLTFHLGETGIDWQGRLVDGVGGVTKASDTVLHRWTPAGGSVQTLREGQALLGSTLKAFYPLAASAPGQTQDRNDGPDGGVPVLAVLGTGSQHVLEAAPGVVTSVAQTGGTSAGTPAGTVFGAFGLPFGADGEWIGGLVKLKTGVGGVTTANALAILAGSASGNYDTLVVRQGDAATDGAGAPLGGVTYKGFRQPLFSGEGDTAYLAALAGAVTTGTDTGIWSRPVGAVAPLLLAREGGEVAEAGAGPVWGKFTALAQPGGATGPLIGGSLAGATVTRANDAGLWGVDSVGALRELLREGATVDGKTVKALHVLKAVPGSLGATRSFNDQGEVVALVLYTNGSSAIVRVTVP